MYDEPEPVENKYFGWFTGIHPVARAAIMFALPFIAVDFFNYYSAGTALVISGPILAIMYAACGALAAKFAAGPDMVTGDYVKTGALAGLMLWLLSTVINSVIGLIIGTASLGTTLLLGVPYLCLCAPIQMIGGALAGMLGAYIYSLVGKSKQSDDDAGGYY